MLSNVSLNYQNFFNTEFTTQAVTCYTVSKDLFPNTKTLNVPEYYEINKYDVIEYHLPVIKTLRNFNIESICFLLEIEYYLFPELQDIIVNETIDSDLSGDYYFLPKKQLKEYREYMSNWSLEKQEEDIDIMDLF